MVNVSVWYIIVIALFAYFLGIYTEKRAARLRSAGQILIDKKTNKILFNFSIMPEDLNKMSYIFMDVKKVNLVNNNDSSNDEID